MDVVVARTISVRCAGELKIPVSSNVENEGVLPGSRFFENLQRNPLEAVFEDYVDILPVTRYPYRGLLSLSRR